ncbi:hypothetical protein [Phenylobacterium sp.]|uniref:hypothetical protein n=1 Tax=Phenylobacterium sp. TaxID=1871053 RepID=UPI0035B2F401
MRYEVTVTRNGQYFCGATLRCSDGETALRRFQDLPLPEGEAELRRGGRLVARRAARLDRTAS